MITVYDVKTGEPIKLDGVDARERISAGLAVRSLENLAKEETDPKEGSKPWLGAQLDAAGVEFDKTASKADLQKLFDDLGGAD